MHLVWYVAVCGTDGKKQGGRGEKKEKNAYASTIILPETSFNQRANSGIREPEIQAFWKESNLYEKLSKSAEKAGAERFVLHDGPPYANGDLHIGHALNKLLKDFINRKQILNGKQVHYIPGWDCHGLPIELKVLQNMKSSERQDLTPVKLRQKAAEFAKETVGKQSESFQRYGIFGDFGNPYLTLDPKFEAAQIGVFGEMFKKGFIFRGRKPVHWSPSSQTALAEAELEYPDVHISKSIYVAFSIEKPSEKLKEYHGEGDKAVKVAIWTTTPWTMPANLAVAVNPKLTYAVVEHGKTGRLLVAQELASSLAVSSFTSCPFYSFLRIKNLTYVYCYRKNSIYLKENHSILLQHLLEKIFWVPLTNIHFMIAFHPSLPEEIILLPRQELV